MDMFSLSRWLFIVDVCALLLFIEALWLLHLLLKGRSLWRCLLAAIPFVTSIGCFVVSASSSQAYQTVIDSSGRAWYLWLTYRPTFIDDAIISCQIAAGIGAAVLILMLAVPGIALLFHRRTLAWEPEQEEMPVQMMMD